MLFSLLCLLPNLYADEPLGKVTTPTPGAAPAGATILGVEEAVALDQRLIAEAKKESQLMANLGYLSDMIGPRLTGSAALKRANEWTADKMRVSGLTEVHLEPYMIPVGWERGLATARIIEPNNGRSLLVASMGWTPGTNGKIEGDIVVMTARNSADLAKYKGKLKNAIVLRGAPMAVRPITDTSMTPPYMDRPRRSDVPPARPEEKSKDGAKPETPGAKPVEKNGQAPKPEAAPTDQPPRFNRQNFAEMQAFRRELTEFLRSEGVAVLVQDAGKPHSLLTAGGGWVSGRAGDDRVSAAEPLPSVFMAHEHYALLHRLATRPEPAKTRVEIEVTNKFLPGPIAVYNTVGEIRGSEKPDEYVVLGAHLDSWDLGQGTTDNGTGSCVVLEAARILARCGTKPKRTIRFVLFSGEEQGLYGSKAYVKEHQVEMPRTSMCLAHDTGTGKVTGIGLQGRPILKPLMDKELVSLKDLGVTDINLRSMGGTDHLSFEQAGVPGFAAQQDMAEYRFTHHSQSDTLDKAKEPELIQGAQVMAIAAMRVANLPALLPRDKPAPQRPEERKSEEKKEDKKEEKK